MIGLVVAWRKGEGQIETSRKTRQLSYTLSHLVGRSKTEEERTTAGERQTMKDANSEKTNDDFRYNEPQNDRC